MTFRKPPEVLTCNGNLADLLTQRIEQGSAGPSEAFSAWMTAKQAARLADDIRRGRILLWAQLVSPRQEQQVCEALLATAGVQRVEVHDLVPVSG